MIRAFVLGLGLTASASAAFAEELVVLNEGFDDNKNSWFVGDNEDVTTEIKGGKYIYEYKKGAAYSHWISKRVHSEDDFKIEMAFKKRFGPEDWGSGLWFGASDANNGFTFTISPNGQYILGELKEAKFITLIEWTKTAQIKQGLDVTNVITLAKSGDKWLFYLNGEYVDRVTARPFYGPLLGFQINHAGKIEVDYLRAIELTAAPVPKLDIARKPDAPVAPPPAANVASNVVLAVFEVEDGSNKLKRADREQLTDYLVARLAGKGGYSIVPKEQLRRSLGEAKKDSFKACYDSSCQIELGKAVAAEAILTTKILRVGAECAITASLFDLKKEVTSKAATVDTSCALKDLLGAIRGIANQL